MTTALANTPTASATASEIAGAAQVYYRDVPWMRGAGFVAGGSDARTSEFDSVVAACTTEFVQELRKPHVEAVLAQAVRQGGRLEVEARLGRMDSVNDTHTKTGLPPDVWRTMSGALLNTSDRMWTHPIKTAQPDVSHVFTCANDRRIIRTFDSSDPAADIHIRHEVKKVLWKSNWLLHPSGDQLYVPAMRVVVSVEYPTGIVGGDGEDDANRVRPIHAAIRHRKTFKTADTPNGSGSIELTTVWSGQTLTEAEEKLRRQNDSDGTRLCELHVEVERLLDTAPLQQACNKKQGADRDAAASNTVVEAFDWVLGNAVMLWTAAGLQPTQFFRFA